MIKEISSQDFFRGNTTSFRPFREEWHFVREQESKILNVIDEEDTDVIDLIGPPGSGRTFLISAIVEKLISEHRAIGIELPTHTLSTIPDSGEINSFLNIIEAQATEIGVMGPQMGVIFSEGEPEGEDLVRFEELKHNTDIPFIFIVETSNGINLSPGYDLSLSMKEFEIQKTIPSERRD
ncbi:MAG: hypothetical protein ABEI13_03130, partial [Candidatus Paceibacteria bacterium]